MTSLTAKVQPASRAARSVLTSVSDAFRALDHVKVSATDSLIELPGLGTVLVSYDPHALVLNIPLDSHVDMPTVRDGVSQYIRHAAGSRSAAAKLVVSWSESEFELLRA